MKKETIFTLMFLVYLVVIFFLFYHNEKKLLAIFASIGSAIYIINLKRIKKDNN